MSVLRFDFRRPVAEILIIVVGVLLALAVDNWNGDRGERNLESQYLARMLDEVSANARRVEANVEIANRKISGLASIDSIVRQPRESRSMTDLVVAIRSGSLGLGWALPEFTDVVFDELRSTGRLGIVRDIELRSMLVNYDRQLADTVERIDNRRGGFAPYVYGLLPPEYLRAENDGAIVSSPNIDSVTEELISAAVESAEFRRLLNSERNYAAFILELMEALQPQLQQLEESLGQAVR